ncbi:MAG: polyprenyl synthetase family protein, partial [Candidatus Pacebacteria bacterium]|nr:polyprenyl synthetase family protein [Candidatus Paceibacterota bacterium]
MVKTIKQNIDIHLAKVIDEAKKDYKLDKINPYLYACIKDFCLRDGKRIRPILLLLSYKGYNPKTKRIPSSLYRASSSIEMLHNFMLIHDDIIDKSDLRRGKPTMHKMLGKIIKTDSFNTLGLDLAIVVGDLIYSLAIDSFLSIDEEPARKQKALKYVIQTATFTAVGEFIDTLDGLRPVKDVKEKDVLLNYSLKTARYTFENPMVTGAILAGADNKEIKKLEKIGLLIGQAFQIQDDIIGMF